VRHMRVFTTAVIAPMFLGFALQSADALGQKTFNEQLAGAWAYVSVDTVRPDGSRAPMYGPNPQGLVIFDLKRTTPEASGGGSGEIVLKRAR
jgi:hypothetical protein